VDAPVDLSVIHAGLAGKGDKEIKAMLGNIGYHARGVGYELDKSLNPDRSASRYNFQNRQQDHQRNRRRTANRNAVRR
jgi:predicted NAD/FAD-binding protein